MTEYVKSASITALSRSLFSRTAFAAGASLALASSASAAVIPGLFNTGTDSTNTALVGGNGVVDNNYKIISSTDPAAGSNGVTYFFGAPYVPNDADSRWISTTASGGSGGTTLFQLTFDLTGLDPTTASISGSVAADNEVDVLLNGVRIGGTDLFSALTPFTASTGFVNGINTLGFRLIDRGPPGALRVDNLQGTADIAKVPEPATWAMMIGGFGAIGAAARRRRVRVAFAR